MARSGLNWRAQDLADKAGVGYATVARFEAGGVINADSLDKLENALAGAGAQFSRRADRLGVTITPSGGVRLPTVRQMIAAAKKRADGPEKEKLIRDLYEHQEAKGAHAKVVSAIREAKKKSRP